MKRFKSPFSNGMLVSTILVGFILVYALYTMAAWLPQYSYTSFTFWGIVLAFCFVVWTMLYAFSHQIKEVVISESELIIKKMFGSIVIPIKDIEEVMPKQSIVSDMRIWGMSGLFGYIGWFYNKQTGRYLALVRDGNCMLTIKTKKNKCYVISCQDHLQAMSLLK